MIIDISQEVFSCKVYPGDPEPEYHRISSIDSGSDYNLTEFSMCAHNGTHIDAPCHFIKDGKTVSQLDLSVFAGECYVARRTGELTGRDAADIIRSAEALGDVKRILIAGYAVVTAAAARVFAGSGLCLLGCEGQTVGSGDSQAEVHRILLGAGTVLLEGAVLDNVSDGRYFLSAAPLNLGDSDGSPCRAYLIKED